MTKYNFDYVFYNPNKIKYLDLCIEKINKVYAEDKRWLEPEIATLTTSFILHQLTQQFQPKESSKERLHDIFDSNKISWSELFVKQPQVQRLMNNFMTELTNSLNQEIIHNKDQLNYYLNYPRTSSKPRKFDEPPKIIPNLTQWQERNRKMNQRLNNISKLRGETKRE